ncbi:hypothetical protein M3Y98_00633800 [Aphelenchoides besseyi]|nr:hypothetical protein M3Y98_00633800 [Aphelenchoides besseyi]
MTKTLDDTMALISDEDDGIDGRFSKKRHMTGGRRMYVVMEVTPSVLCLLVLILLIILSYPYWPTSDRSSNPALRIVDRPIIAEKLNNLNNNISFDHREVNISSAIDSTKMTKNI